MPQLPKYIFGMHDAGAENLMTSVGKPGWVLFSEQASSDGGNYANFAQQGLGVIVRLNHRSVLRRCWFMSRLAPLESPLCKASKIPRCSSKSPSWSVRETKIRSCESLVTSANRQKIVLAT